MSVYSQLTGDKLAVEQEAGRKRPELGKHWGHVPAAPAPNCEAVLS